MFYRENSTHIWNDNNTKLSFLLKYIYPLRIRPFGNLLLPSPASPDGYFKSIGVKNLNSLCIRDVWNHRMETTQKRLVFKCSDLKNFYPFVHRNCNKTHCEENLILKNRSLQKFYFKSR